MQADVVIVGGGIVGLATAYRLTTANPDRQIVLIEKEPEVGTHQSGHNSGVLHSGIYYKPGSLKAQNCRTGKAAMEEFCEREGIDYEICGKVIVAVDDSEVPAMEKIYERGQANGVTCEIIGPERLKEIEPYAAGVKAIYVPESGIVNYAQVSRRMAELIEQHGGKVHKGTRVTGLSNHSDAITVQSTQGDFQADWVVNCGGLQSDRVAKMSGVKPDAKIVPFRGEFYELKKEAYHLCNHLIYPVPDPSFPFLGVHFTRMIDGSVECGPNAVLAFAREGYRKLDINLFDLCESLTYSGFRKLAWKYWKVGMGEMWRSFSKRAFVKALQRLLPAIESKHLVPARAGVRAQALSPDGNMVDDFLIQKNERVVNVCNAPSPGATSSLNIGTLIADEIQF